MTESEFLAKWNTEAPMYMAWGNFVQKQIMEALVRTHPYVKPQEFLKISCEPRLKTADSLLGKAFHRDKGYDDPYTQIEDKVGLRFVVLLTSDIQKLQSEIERSELWDWSLDKDYEADRHARPLEFAYQSKHYVLKTRADTDTPDGAVSRGTPCEVQLRTLLQHAHSELTHDNIYKRDAETVVSKRVERTVAKSMALIETVDEFFLAALNEIEQANEPERKAAADLCELYAQHVGHPAQIDKTTTIVLHAFRDQFGSEFRGKVEALLSSKPFIPESIRRRWNTQYIFRQPWILLAYLVVGAQPEQTKDRWPLTLQEIEPVFTDMGKGL